MYWHSCDVRNEDDWTELWDSTEAYFSAPVDILVNNAGINPIHGWRKTMDICIVKHDLIKNRSTEKTSFSCFRLES